MSNSLTIGKKRLAKRNIARNRLFAHEITMLAGFAASIVANLAIRIRGD